MAHTPKDEGLQLNFYLVDLVMCAIHYRLLCSTARDRAFPSQRDVFKMDYSNRTH